MLSTELLFDMRVSLYRYNNESLQIELSLEFFNHEAQKNPFCFNYTKVGSETSIPSLQLWSDILYSLPYAITVQRWNFSGDERRQHAAHKQIM